MKIEVTYGDITKVKVDAIVNAANTSLLGGSGVDGAIHRTGGKAILNECQEIRNKQGKCKVGESVITTAGNLPAKKIIHTVGPVYTREENAEKENKLLANCYKNSLNLANEYNFKSIAFPNISTGIYRFPKLKAAEIAIKTVLENATLDKVIFVCFDKENYKIYKTILDE